MSISKRIISLNSNLIKEDNTVFCVADSFILNEYLII